MIQQGAGGDVKGGILFSEEQWTIVFDSLDLSPRQREITLCLFDDMGEGAIALRTGLRKSTVKGYIARLYRKLCVNSRTEFLIVVFRAHLTHMQTKHRNAERELFGR